MATVREVMDTDLPSVREDTKIEEVLRVMRGHELPGVVVTDADGGVAGIITEADLVLPDEEGSLHLPHYIELFGGVVFLEPLQRFEDSLRKAFAAKASDMMTRDPTTVTEDTDIHEAARLIHTAGHNRLPVTGEDGKLVGVVTRVDVLGALTQ